MKKPFHPAALARIEFLSAPAASPDGEEFACVKTEAEEAAGEFTPRIMLMDRRTGDQRLLEFPGAAKAPAWSPDGRYLAFLGAADGVCQVWARSRDGGAFRQVTTLRHGVEGFVWSPDGGSLAFEAKLRPEDIEQGLAFAEMTAEQRAAWRRERAAAPVEITDIIYKYDGEGLLDGSLSCIGTMGVDGGNPLLLPADFPCLKPAWSPDGGRLAFYGRPYSGVRARRSELFVCGRDGGSLRQLTDGAVIMAGNPPCFTADGRSVIYDPWPELPNDGMVQSLYAVPVEGGEARELFDREADTCYGINGLPVGRTFFGEETPQFRLSGDGAWIYFQSAWHGRGGLFRLSLADRSVEPVVYGNFTVQSFCLTGGDEVLYTLGAPDRIAELYFRGERLTRTNGWLEQYEIAPVEELSVPSGDGGTAIQGWVMHPAGQRDAVKYPAVLDIRGGPETTTTADFWHEYQAFAAAGMAVIYCNPRGGMGYGPAFNENGVAWSGAADDLLAFVDGAAALGFIDASRIGVTGGSYGGYMTNKLINDTDRFAAAAVQRTLCNTCTSYGTGDMGFASARGPVPAGFKMLDYLTDRARKSLICRVDEIRTPLLILHGYQDYRCSFEQAEQLFVAMKERNPGVPVRLVMFPGENHDITRTGSPGNQIRHLQELTDWFCKYLVDSPGEGGDGHGQA